MNDTSEKQLIDLMRMVAESIKKDIEVKIPCVVTAVTSRKKVTVRPLIKIVDRNGDTYSREVIEGVPVFMPGAGGMLLSFPVEVGDKGWLEASDRDLSVFLQSFNETEPTTKRMHSFSDGLFVPDVFEGYTIAEEDASAVLMQSLNGSVKIAVDGDSVRITNGSVNVTVTDSTVTGTASGGFNLNGFTIGSDGSASSPVSIAAPSILANSVEVVEHTHGGVTSGSSVTNIMGA